MLIVGLGNPGRRYERTRHNVGYEVVDVLLDRWRGELLGSNRLYALWSAEREGESVLLMKPQTYMNRSGIAVSLCARERDIAPAGCLVVVDDMFLDVGRLRFRRRGSSGGHNGLESIEARLRTMDYPRLRIGVGPAPVSAEWADFVLTEVEDPDERETLDGALRRAADGIEMLLTDGIDQAMSQYNR